MISFHYFLHNILDDERFLRGFLIKIISSYTYVALKSGAQLGGRGQYLTPPPPLVQPKKITKYIGPIKMLK